MNGWGLSSGVDFSVYPHMAEGARELYGVSLRTLIPFKRVPPSWLHLLKAWSNTVTLAIRNSTCEFWGLGALNIQRIAMAISWCRDQLSPCDSLMSIMRTNPLIFADNPLTNVISEFIFELKFPAFPLAVTFCKYWFNILIYLFLQSPLYFCKTCSHSL